MSTTTLDERLHASALKAAIKARLGPRDAYDYGRVPGDKNNPDEDERDQSLPDIFVLVSVERTYNANVNMAAKAGTTGWRVEARSVGRTVDEARWAMAKVALALNEVSLVIAGRATTALQYESGRAPAPDDGLFSGTSQWTYNH